MVFMLSQANFVQAQYRIPYYPINFTDFQPLDYFDADNQGDFEGDNGNASINAYLCAYLSDRIYAADIGISEAWEEAFELEMLAFGATYADFYNSTQTGAEVGVVETSDAMIIVHRGSSMAGTPLILAGADWAHDLNAEPSAANIGGVNMHLHEGFRVSQNSVHWWVRQQAMRGTLQGKKIWVTGHSLGGASATLTAARLHYDAGIEIQGVLTFGSPKVGDKELQKLFTLEGAGGVALEDRSHRFAVEGDFATTLFHHGYITKKIYNGFYYYNKTYKIYYRHVGQTNHIYQTPTGIGYSYDVDYDTVDRSNLMYAPIWSLGPGGAHGMYAPAMEAEMIRILLLRNRGNDLIDIQDG